MRKGRWHVETGAAAGSRTGSPHRFPVLSLEADEVMTVGGSGPQRSTGLAPWASRGACLGDGDDGTDRAEGAGRAAEPSSALGAGEGSVGGASGRGDWAAARRLAPSGAASLRQGRGPPGLPAGLPGGRIGQAPPSYWGGGRPVAGRWRRARRGYMYGEGPLAAPLAGGAMDVRMRA